MKNIIAWIAEMIVECILGAYAVLLVFGTSAAEMTVLDNMKQNVGLVLFFILSSGYFATTAAVAVIKPQKSTLVQSWINILLFCAHAGVFLAVTGAQAGRTIGVLVLGIGIVAFANLIGATLRAL